MEERGGGGREFAQFAFVVHYFTRIGTTLRARGMLFFILVIVEVATVRRRSSLSAEKVGSRGARILIWPPSWFLLAWQQRHRLDRPAFVVI